MTTQPPPIPNDSTPIWDLVIEDMSQRDRIGRERYGTPLQAHNGRDALRDAYEEALDLAAYLRQCIAERDAARKEQCKRIIANCECEAMSIRAPVCLAFDERYQDHIIFDRLGVPVAMMAGPHAEEHGKQLVDLINAALEGKS